MGLYVALTMRLAVFIVSPKRQNLGILLPTGRQQAPATAGQG